MYNNHFLDLNEQKVLGDLNKINLYYKPKFVEWGAIRFEGGEGGFRFVLNPFRMNR